MVGSTHPGGEAAPKGLAVRQLKRYASWVQTVNQNLLLLTSSAAFDGNIGVKNRLISVKSFHYNLSYVRIIPREVMYDKINFASTKSIFGWIS